MNTAAFEDQHVSFSLNEVYDPMVIIDENHKIVDANGPFMMLFKYSDECLSKEMEIHELVPEGVREAHRGFVDAIFRSPVVRSMSDPTNKVRGVLSDGTTIPISVTFYPIRDEAGVCRYFAAIVIKRAQAEVPLWRQAQNWVPFVVGLAATTGWLCGVEGARELLIGVTGVRLGVGCMAVDQKTLNRSEP